MFSVLCSILSVVDQLFRVLCSIPSVVLGCQILCKKMSNSIFSVKKRAIFSRKRTKHLGFHPEILRHLAQDVKLKFKLEAERMNKHDNFAAREAAYPDLLGKITVRTSERCQISPDKNRISLVIYVHSYSKFSQNIDHIFI